MKKQLILIEDDPALCENWKELFELLDYRGAFFRSGSEALAAPEILNDAGLLITDYYLPDMTGAEVIRRARQVQPSLATVLLTGSREAFITEFVERVGNCVYLNKPVNIEELERVIEAAC